MKSYREDWGYCVPVEKPLSLSAAAADGAAVCKRILRPVWSTANVCKTMEVRSGFIKQHFDS